MEDGHSNAGSKDYLVSLMFSHYDLNNNGLLEAEELSKVSISFFFFSIKFGCSKRIIQMIPESFSPKQLSDDWNLVPLPQCYCYSFLV